jgi:hypothetical protein
LQHPYNASYAHAVGFKTNWDLSGTFMPYDGLFLPYTEEWQNLGPINGGLAQYNVTVRALPGHSSAISAFQRESGLHGAFVWARRAPGNQKRRCLAWAVRHDEQLLRGDPGVSSPTPPPSLSPHDTIQIYSKFRTISPTFKHIWQPNAYL